MSRKPLKQFDITEVAKHCDEESCYIVIYDKVYDVTKFIFEHPGGDEVLLEYGGKDATEAFEDVGHSTDARTMMKDYLIGELRKEVQETDNFMSQFKCPVCKDIPEGNIFNCKNSHMICSSCLSSTRSCPSCSTSLVGEENQIRDTALEVVLNKLKFPCPNKNLGCEKSLNRSEIKVHSKKECEIGGIKVALCNKMGSPECKFECNSRKIESIVEHFQSNHDTAVIQASSANIEYTNFVSTFKRLMSSRSVGTTTILTRVGHEIIIRL